VTAGSGGASAVRGHAISFRADPFRDDDALIDISDALIVTRDGLITDFGPHEQVRQRLPRDAEVVAYPRELICPGFIDGHVHYPQTPIIGSYSGELAD
jgi:guanine deaminase